ncbi:MAG: cupin domain-containing protein [Bryobacteraceae bacterium]|nr:cupin domain-containing protein [Bryobacteraceae bacterium]
MTLHDWSTIAAEPMNDKVTRRVIHTAQMTIARLEMQAGAHVPEHAHPNEQVSMVERGLLRFHIEGREVLVGAGQSLEIPPHVPHSVDVVEDAAVTDLFTPKREDWLRGEDAYLRG